MLNGAIRDFNISARLAGQDLISTQFFMPPAPNETYSACLAAKIDPVNPFRLLSLAGLGLGEPLRAAALLVVPLGFGMSLTTTAVPADDGWLLTGDTAERDNEGNYRIRGRLKDLVVSGGENIYPAEIEAVLHEHPAVADAAVVGVPDDEWGESVKAVIQLRTGASATSEELLQFCSDRLAGYKKPRSIDFVDELPRDAAGKLLKRAIREPYWAGAGRLI